jgi:hypothetical protein
LIVGEVRPVRPSKSSAPELRRNALPPAWPHRCTPTYPGP